MMVMLGPLPKQHPDYHPGRPRTPRPWWFRPDRAISHAAWFRAMAEVEACSPDRGGRPAPTVWRVYADTVSPPSDTGRLRMTVDLDRSPGLAVDVATGRVTYDGHELTAGDAGRFTRTQDPA